MLNIGVIDSGIGGLTVLFDVIKKYPSCNYYYIGDNKNCPYGEKKEAEIKKLSYRLVKYLKDKKNIDILIIACNSISSTSTSYLKNEFKDLIIIETVKPTTDYVKKIGYKNALVIATNATVNSKMYSKNLDNYNVFEKACPKFVEIVEDVNISNDERDLIVYNELINDINNIDTIILGCTHFPLLKNSILKFFDGKIIKSSEGIIYELSKYIPNMKSSGKLEIFTTGDNNLFENKLNIMFNKDIKVDKINL